MSGRANSHFISFPLTLCPRSRLGCCFLACVASQPSMPTSLPFRTVTTRGPSTARCPVCNGGCQTTYQSFMGEVTRLNAATVPDTEDPHPTRGVVDIHLQQLSIRGFILALFRLRFRSDVMPRRETSSRASPRLSTSAWFAELRKPHNRRRLYVLGVVAVL